MGWTIGYFVCQAIVVIAFALITYFDIKRGGEVGVTIKDIGVTIVLIAIAPLTIIFIMMYIFETYGDRPLFKFKMKSEEE